MAGLNDKTRGRILEEFLISKQLYIMNEERVNTTFWNRRGASNVDLTIIHNQLLRTVVEWEISEKENCPDQSTIKYSIEQGTSHMKIVCFQDAGYIVKKRELCKFPGKPDSISEEDTLQVK